MFEMREESRYQREGDNLAPSDQVKSNWDISSSNAPAPGMRMRPKQLKGAAAKEGSSVWALTRLGRMLFVRFERLKHMEDLQVAIFCQSLASKFTKDDDPDKPLQLSTLAASYYLQYRHTRKLADLNKSRNCFVQSEALTPVDDPSKHTVLMNLGAVYANRFELFGESSDFNQAFASLGVAMVLTPDDHPDKPEAFHNLGRLYLTRFEHTGDAANLTRAVECQVQAVSLSSNGHPHRLIMLDGLADLYRIQFETLGKLPEFDEAFKHNSQAMVLAPDGDKGMRERFSDRAFLYGLRFQRFGQLADVNRAIEWQIIALGLPFVPDSYVQGQCMHDHWQLGDFYTRRFEHLHDISDIEKAIYHQNQAVSISLVRYAPEQHSGLLHALGASFMHRFHYLGEVQDVDRAIDYLRQALTHPHDNHENKEVVLMSLGTAFQQRFQRLNEFADIDRSIKYQTQVVSITPKDHVARPVRLNSLGTAYQSKFELAPVRNAEYLCKALDCHIEAVTLAPDSHRLKPDMLNNLGSAYTYKFRATGELASIDKAIECISKADLLTCDEHSLKPIMLSGLASAYESRFKHNGRRSDLDQALSCHRKALRLIPDCHAKKPAMLNSLGVLLAWSKYQKYLLDPQLKDISTSAAAQCFRQAAQSTAGSPRERFRAARGWALLSYWNSSTQLLAHRKTMELLPQLAWLGVNIDQRYHFIADMRDAAMEAAACAISVGDYNLALKWLEEGRSIVWNQILQLRTAFDDISIIDPALAKRLKEVSHQLENLGSRPSTNPFSKGDPLDLEHETQHHHHLASEWDHLLKNARDIPGLESFMQPREAKELLGAAQHGPIVVINVHTRRCDALVIRPDNDEIAHIPLESFSFEKAQESQQRVVSLVGHRGSRAGGFKRRNSNKPQLSFKPMLATLWSDIVKPILDFLGYTHKLPVDELPRITWCTTGPLSFLPLHAAGLYDGVHPNIFDLVISSYTPTLGALLARDMPTADPQAGILAIGQEYTVGLNSLPYTVRELEVIKERAKESRYLQLDGDSATMGAVLNAMEDYSWVHLACHATQDKSNPTQSAFHLCDGNLTIAEITKKSLKNKGFAFLSACQTATGDEQLPEEAIHLAAGMLMAGYPSVIATMWSIDDEDAPEIARRVYAELLKDGKMDCRGAAKALHKAVGEMRDRIGEDSFRRWVPFIHIGL